MNDPKTIAERYVALWNETDPVRRGTMLSENWTSDAVYADPLMAGQGVAEIGALIAGVQQRFPDFRFAFTGKADGFGKNVRFSWTLGPEGADAPIEGTDIAVIEAGRIAAITGFLDKVPAG